MALEPYYVDERVTIYHADCRDVLPALDAHPSLLLTDPPNREQYEQAVAQIRYAMPAALAVIEAVRETVQFDGLEIGSGSYGPKYDRFRQLIHALDEFDGLP